MMNKIATYALLIITLAGCYSIEYQERVEAELQLDISIDVLPEDQQVPTSLSALFQGEVVSIEVGGSVDLGTTLLPGDYELYIYSDNDLISVTQSSTGEVLATVAATKSTEITANPGDIFFCAQPFTIHPDGAFATTESELEPLIRELSFELNVKGDADNELLKVDATLSGVAQQWSCLDSLAVGDAAWITPELTKTTSESGGYTLTGKVKMLAIQGSEQLLTLTLSFEDDYPASYTIISDISDELNGFNQDKSCIMTLSGNVMTPTSSNETGTITDWSVNWDEDITLR